MKSIMIFSGANDRAIIAFCRYAISKNINLCIVANGLDDLVLLTEYKRYVVFVREKNVLDIEQVIDNINLIKSKFKWEEIFILPSTEYLNRFLLEYESTLVKHKVSFGLCNRELYENISNKYNFSKLCHSYDINLPESIISKPTIYPYVVKPRRYFNSSKELNIKPLIIRDKKDEIMFSSIDENELYYQKYIEGKSIYLLFYFFENGDFSMYSQENYIQQADGESMILSASKDYHLNKDLVTNYINLFVSERYTGLVMVEVKEDNGKFYMIEANPRLWGPSQLILDAQMDLFDCFAFDNKLITKLTKQTYLPNTWYYWSGGYIENIKKKLSVTFHNFSQNNLEKKESEIKQNEVYQRNDTLNIYEFENKLND